MILTECCYCNEPMIVNYEAGNIGAGGFTEIICKKCGKTNVVELVSYGGTTYSEE